MGGESEITIAYVAEPAAWGRHKRGAWRRGIGPSLRRWGGRAVLLGFALIVVTGVLIRHEGAFIVGGPADEVGLAAPPSDTLSQAATISIGSEVGHGISAPAGVIALTFDDGPDPVYTEQILEVLALHDVRATFFVIGEKVIEFPDTARSVVKAGHDLGNHTHLHYAMGELGSRQARTQLELARLAIVDVTGVTTSLYRAPYSGSITRMSAPELAAAQAAQRGGYNVVATDLAPRDHGSSVSADQLLRDAIPRAGEGAIITLHDGGGDRSATVEVLGPLIVELRSAGYEFVTVGELVAHASGVAPVQPASPMLRLRATAFERTMTVTGWIEKLAVASVVVFMVLYVGRMLALIILALVDRVRADDVDTTSVGGRVTVIVPAYNEEVGIAASLLSIEQSDYHDLEILVVDDGSTDGTAEVARALALERVTVLSKPNGGKSSALNYGILHATGDMLVMVDGDTLLEPETVSRIVAPFSDPEVGAVAGNPKIGNARNLITRMQVSEYLIASSLERRLLGVVGMITTIPGAIGAWRRSALQEVGYVSTQTLAEDTDLTIALARGGWKVRYVADSRAWTEAPSTCRSLYRQRTRWTFGTLQVLWKHRRGCFDRGQGSQVGRLALPYMFVSGYLLGALGPLVDLVLLANVYLGSWRLAVASWLAISALAVVAGLTAAWLDGDRLRGALLVPLQQLVYRPVMQVIALNSLRRAAVGERQVWGAQERVGGLAVGIAES